MLQDQFYMRLILLIAVGIVYVKAFMNMAKRNSKETKPERHPILKVLGFMAASLGVLMGVGGVYLITQITFPQEAIGPYISPNMIVRPSYKTMYWGYATMAQSQSISLISGLFEGFALSAYCFLYKSSHSKWYTKIGKVIFCILFFMLYASATDFHYFDLYEWTAPVLFAIMAFFALRNNKDHAIGENIVSVSLESDEPKCSLGDEEDNSRYMPVVAPEIEPSQTTTKDNDNDVQEVPIKLQDEAIHVPEANLTSHSEHEPKNTDDDSSREEQESMSSSYSLQNINFCRHCGEKLDYISDKYCKHCGKPLL